MSLATFLGRGSPADEPPRAAITKIATGFLFDPKANDCGLSSAIACANADELADAVRAWALSVAAPAKPAPKPKTTKKPVTR